MRKLYLSFILIVLLAFVGGSVNNPPVLASTVIGTKSFTASDAPDILVNPVQGPSISSQLKNRTKSSWPWYITRAAGFVAAISLVLLMLSGIGFITGATFRFLEPLTAWATHKAIALVFVVSGAIHVLALLFDRFVPFSIAQVLLPFLSHYRQIKIGGIHVGSLYVALGVLSMYFVLAIVLASIFWIDKKPHIWKIIHFLAYLTMIFVFFHALYLGTDLTHGVFRILWVILGVGVAIAIMYRLRRRIIAK